MSAKFKRRLILAGQSPHIASPLDKGGSRDRRARRPSTTPPPSWGPSWGAGGKVLPSSGIGEL